MKKIIYSSILFASLFLFQSCDRDSYADYTFDVSTSKSSYKVGEEVEFNFSGNPYMITYYSGEDGKKCEYKDRTTADGRPKLEFTSLAANGDQENTLHLMISKDFQGVVVGDESATLSNIAKATWTDITYRAVLSSGTSTASGEIDLSDFAVIGEPVSLAFKYTAESGSIQRKWTISNLKVTHELTDGSIYTLVNLTSTAINNYGNNNLFSPGWVSYNTINAYKWTVGSTLVITGATSDSEAELAEAWAISGFVDLKTVTPDLGVVVKNITTRKDSYKSSFSHPGSYTATFVGSNANVYSTTERAKQIQLIITE